MPLKNYVVNFGKLINLRTGFLTECCLMVVLNLRFNYGHEVHRKLASCKWIF